MQRNLVIDLATRDFSMCQTMAIAQPRWYVVYSYAQLNHSTRRAATRKSVDRPVMYAIARTSSSSIRHM